MVLHTRLYKDHNHSSKRQLRPLLVRGFFFLAMLVCTLPGLAQLRGQVLTADYSIKEVLPDGSTRLNMGKLTFDEASMTLTYRNTFPEVYEILINDTAIHIYKNKALFSSEPANELNHFSIFYLVLKSNLATFGLEGTPFAMVETKLDGGMVLSRWESDVKTTGPNKAFEIALKDGKLYGIISLGKNDLVLGKQFFSNYIQSSGYYFPALCEEIRYEDGSAHKKVTSYSNVVIK
jgi:hypothetical protein